MNQTHDDEIDLFELFEFLWSGKWLIAGFTALSLILGGGFLALKEAVYESKLFIKIDDQPPFYGRDKVFSDFEKLFYSKQTFDDWKKGGGNTSITFEDLSKTENVDGFELLKEPDNLLALFRSEKKSGNSILIKSGHPNVLDSLYNYSNFVKNSLNNNYAMRARSELNLIETRFNNVSPSRTDDNIVQTLLSTDRFIASLKNGGNVLTIEKPTIPKKTSPKTKLVFALSVILGGMVGAVLVLVRSAIAKRKDQLT